MMEEDDNRVDVVTNVYMVSSNKGWWIDIRATRHICGDKFLFTTYEKLNGTKKVYMGNTLASTMEEKCKVLLK